MRYILTFLLGLISLLAFSQSETNLPITAKQLSNQVWIDDDDVLWTGKEGKFIALGTKEYVDSLIGTIVTDGIEDIIAGANIIINKTDPKNPIISSTGGGEGSADWGEISGTLSDQLDLWAELVAKAISGTGSTQVRNNSQLDLRYIQSITDRLLAGTNVNFTGAGTPASPLVINATNTTYNGINGISLTGTNFAPTYGTTSNTIAQGNDSRINNGQTAFSWGNHSGLYVPLARTISINGVSYDLSENRSWTISGEESTTNLALGTRTANTMPITNSNGTGVTLLGATDELAGLMTAEEQSFAGLKQFYNGVNMQNAGHANGVYFGSSANGLSRASGQRMLLRSNEELYLQGVSGLDGFGIHMNGAIRAGSYAGTGNRMAAFDPDGDLIALPIPSGGGGTVISVGLSAPTGFSISGSPVTTSGTLGFNWASGYQAYTSAEASKLAGIASGANNYVLPTATIGVTGGIRLWSDVVQTETANSVTSTANRTYGVQLNSTGGAVVNVPWDNSVYTPSASILISGNNVQRAALTGDVTASANSNTTTIANSAVTFPKMQNISSQRILGRSTAGSGNIEELTLGSNMTLVGGVLNSIGGGGSYTANNGIQLIADNFSPVYGTSANTVAEGNHTHTAPQIIYNIDATTNTTLDVVNYPIFRRTVTASTTYNISSISNRYIQVIVTNTSSTGATITFDTGGYLGIPQGQNTNIAPNTTVLFSLMLMEDGAGFLSRVTYQ